MKLTFASKFEKWLDPILNAAWYKTPRIIGGIIMTIGIVTELLVYFIQTISSLFVLPVNKEKDKDKKNSLSTNPLENDDEH